MPNTSFAMPLLRRPPLEEEPYSKLHLPWRCLGGRDAARLVRHVDDGRRRSEMNSVRNVEDLRAQFEPAVVCEPETATEREIEIQVARPAKHVAAAVAERDRR